MRCTYALTVSRPRCLNVLPQPELGKVDNLIRIVCGNIKQFSKFRVEADIPRLRHKTLYSLTAVAGRKGMFRIAHTNLQSRRPVPPYYASIRSNIARDEQLSLAHVQRSAFGTEKRREGRLKHGGPFFAMQKWQLPWSASCMLLNYCVSTTMRTEVVRKYTLKGSSINALLPNDV
jgi:hypothetical protein